MQGRQWTLNNFIWVLQDCHPQGMWNREVLPSLGFSAGLGNLQDYNKWFWIPCFSPWVMTALSSEWSFCDTKPRLFILTLYLWGKTPLLFQVVTQFVIKVHFHLSPTQKSAVAALRGASSAFQICLGISSERWRLQSENLGKQRGPSSCNPTFPKAGPCSPHWGHLCWEFWKLGWK